MHAEIIFFDASPRIVGKEEARGWFLSSSSRARAIDPMVEHFRWQFVPRHKFTPAWLVERLAEKQRIHRLLPSSPPMANSPCPVQDNLVREEGRSIMRLDWILNDDSSLETEVDLGKN
jgi:hypothetical protein